MEIGCARDVLLIYRLTAQTLEFLCESVVDARRIIGLLLNEGNRFPMFHIPRGIGKNIPLAIIARIIADEIRTRIGKFRAGRERDHHNLALGCDRNERQKIPRCNNHPK